MKEVKSNYQNEVKAVQMPLDLLPNFLNKSIKNGVNILRVVKNGFNSDNAQMVHVDYLELIRA